MTALNRKTFYILHFLVIIFSTTQAQERLMRMGGRSGGAVSGMSNRMSGAFSGGGMTDSLEHRDKYEDSITIYYQVPSSVQSNKLDSSINDFNVRFPIPATHVFLGNTGNATRSILFSPEMQSGWDPGFHAFDVYRKTIETARFFNTTRPYTELAYLLGGRTEQIIGVTHTQNIKPNWNGLFEYRLINAPGFFKNQKTNHNNYLFTSWYQSINKRYNNYFILLNNKLQSEENGGISDKQDYLDDPAYNDRFNIPTRLGGDVAFGRNFFTTSINTGNKYQDVHFLLKQQYDLGRKDSIVTDSTVIPLFYPRLRFEHMIQYSKYKFEFIDYSADSTYYKNNYNLTLPGIFDSVSLRDTWKELINEFSIYQYPDAKNLLQFFKAGIMLQNLKAETDSFSGSFYNLAIHGEYRNKTRNRKWDMVATGKFYLNGFNSGNYETYFSLKRFVAKKGGYIDLGFRNTNRTPSFVFDERSSFYLDIPKNFNNENITRLSASLFQPGLNVRISGNYYLVSNYVYFDQFYKPEQNEALFNLLMLTLEKRFRLGKNFSWYTDIYLQKETGNAPVNVPLIFIRNRIGYEGTLGYKKLHLATGFEIKYHTPYDADGYSPLLGKFYYQDSIQISNRPDISFYLHFRIRNFRAFLRAENLNTMTTLNGFGFKHHNFAAPGYPYPGLNIRMGIYWTFVN